MKACILINPYLAAESEFYQPRRIAEELSRRGVRADVLPNAYRVSVGRGEAEETLSREYDFCVYLDKDRYAPRILEKRGLRLFNRAEAVELCDDKMLTHIALSGEIPMPKTFCAPLMYRPQASPVPFGEISRLGYPVIVKECFGSLGKQVYLARNEEELAALGEALKLRPHLFQEWIGESAGRDLRAICVGGEVIACMERRSGSGDFRSNIACGGKGRACAPSSEVKKLSRRASEILGLDYCGIDFLFAKEGMLLCEVNSNAFFGGIEEVTGVNVAGAYVEYILQNVQK